MQTDDDNELTTEVDAEGYRVDHRSETEQSSQSKEVHEYADRTEIRLRDDKEVRLEEIKSRETTRPATYDEILALLEAEYDGLEEVQTREVTVEEFNRHETTRELVTDGELKREMRITDARRKEEILEGPSDTKREVSTETHTTVVNPGGYEEPETPRTLPSGHAGEPSNAAVSTGAGPIGGGVSVTVSPPEVDFRVKSVGLTAGVPEASGSGQIGIPTEAGTGSGNLGVRGEVDAPGATGSLHRIQHRKHVIEELIVEDVDTFYEDQSKPAKKKRALMKKKGQKEDTGEGARTGEQKMIIGVEASPPQPSFQVKAPAGASIASPPPAADTSVRLNLDDAGGVNVQPRDVIASLDKPTGNPNSITYVVTYDAPAGARTQDVERRKKDIHPKKKKDKRRSAKQKQEIAAEFPADTNSVTYIVNYEPSSQKDARKLEPKAVVVSTITKPEVKLPERTIPAQENLSIQVDVNAGDVKVPESVNTSGDLSFQSKTFLVETPAVEKPTVKPIKLKADYGDDVDGRLSADEDMTYTVNYDLPGAATAASLKKSVEPPKVDLDVTDAAPVYSISVLDHGSESVETDRSVPKVGKKVNDAYQMTYVVNYDEKAGLTADTGKAKLPEKSGEVWVKPHVKTSHEGKAGFRGKGDVDLKHKDVAVPDTAETMTYIVEYDKEADVRGGKGLTTPKAKKGSPDENVEKMYTYIVHYDKPEVQPKVKKKKGEKIKGGKVTAKVEKPAVKRPAEVAVPVPIIAPEPSPEFSITVKHPAPKAAVQDASQEFSISVAQPWPEPPKEDVSIKVPEPKLDIQESEEFSIAVEHPFPEPKKKLEQSEEFFIAVDYPFPEPKKKLDMSEDFSFAVEHPFPEPKKKLDMSEDFSFAVEHPFPEPKKKLDMSEDFSFAVEHPFPEPKKKLDMSEDFSFAVEHPYPEPKKKLDMDEEFSISVEHPFPEPKKKLEASEEFFIAADYPYPEPKKNLETSEEFSFAVEHPFPKPKEKLEMNKEFSISVEHPFPETKKKLEPSEEFSIAVEHPFPEPAKPKIEHSFAVQHPIPKPSLSIKEPELPELPEQFSRKDLGESVTYTVTHDPSKIRGKKRQKPSKKKSLSWFSRGKKYVIEPEARPETPETFTYIVNYDMPLDQQSRPQYVQKDVEFEEGRLKAKRPEMIAKGTAKIPEPSASLAIKAEHPEAKVAVTPKDVSAKALPTAETMTFVVNYDEPSGGKGKKVKTRGLGWGRKKPEPAVKLETYKSIPERPQASLDVHLPSVESKTMSYDVVHERQEAAAKARVDVDVQPVDQEVSIKMEQPVIPPIALPPTKLPERGAGTTKTYIVTHEEPAPKAVKKKGVKGKPTESNEMVTYIVNYDDSKTSAAASKVQVPPPLEVEETDISLIKFAKLPEGHIRTEAPAVEIDTEFERSLPEVDANAQISLPELEVRESFEPIVLPVELPRPKVSAKIEPPSERLSMEVEHPREIIIEPPSIHVTKGARPEPPAIDISKGARPESMTYIVNYEEPALKLPGKVKKEKKKVGVGVPLKKAAKDVELKEPESLTYVVEYDVSGKDVLKPAIVPPAKIKAEKKAEIKVPEIPKAKTQIEAFTPRIETSIPEISAEIPEHKVEIETPAPELSIRVDEPLPQVSADIHPPSERLSMEVEHPREIIIEPPSIHVSKEAGPESMTYIVNYEEPALKLPEKVKKEKKKVGFGVPLKKGAKDLELKEPESVTYVVEYDVSGKKGLKPSVVPPAKIKVEEKAEIKVPEISEVKTRIEAPAPKIEAFIPEISAEIPEPQVEIETPVPELSVKVEEPLPPVIAEIQQPSEKVSIEVEQPREVIIEPPSIDISKGARPESMTYIVNYEEPALKLPEKVKKEKKKVGVGVPLKKAARGAELKEPESVTYVVTYDVSGKDVLKPAIVPPAKIKVEEKAEIKVPEIPKVKTTIEVPTPRIEASIPEISAEIPEHEVEIETPVPELSVRVEEPLPHASAEIQPPSEKVSIEVEHPREIIVEPPSIDVSKGLKPESITYVVNYEEPTVKLPEKAKKEKKKVGVGVPHKEAAKDVELKEPESVTYVVTYDVTGKKGLKPSVLLPAKIKVEEKAEIKVPEIPEVKKRIEAPTPRIEAFIPEISAEIPESHLEVEAPAPELSVRVEEAVPQVGAEIQPPSEKVSIEVEHPRELIVEPPSIDISKGARPESMTYIVNYEEPALKLPEKVKKEKKKVAVGVPLKKAAKDVELKEPESMTYVVEYDVSGKKGLKPSVVPPAKFKVEEKAKIELPSIPPSKITVEQPRLELSTEVERFAVEIAAEIPETLVKVEEPTSKLSVEVEEPLPEVPKTEVEMPFVHVGAEITPPSIELPKRDIAESVTYVVAHEEPSVKISGDLKPETKVRVPGKTVLKELKAGGKVKAKAPVAVVAAEPLPPTTEKDKAVSGATETVTYIVEHQVEPNEKEPISTAGKKKREDWSWRVKKPGETIDVSVESKDRGGVSFGEVGATVLAEAQAPRIAAVGAVETPKAVVETQGVPKAEAVPESHTYIVTYDDPYWASLKGKKPSRKLEADAKTKQTKWIFLRKKEPQVKPPSIDIQPLEVKPGEVFAGEPIEITSPALPEIDVEREEVTVEADLGKVTIPPVPELAAEVELEKPSEELVVSPPHLEHPIRETEGIELEIEPTQVSEEEFKFALEASLPGKKEIAFVEKIIGEKLPKAEIEEERIAQTDKDRSVIAGQEENINEEKVVYIVNYDQPFGSLPRTKQPGKEAEVIKEVVTPTVKDKDSDRLQLQRQKELQQLEQCILVPVHDESSPEDSFYGTDESVSSWPPTDDEPLFDEDTSRPGLDRKFETKWPSSVDDKLPPHLVVVAIDFGTTFSGYAFSFANDSSGSIHVMRKWEGGDPGAVDYKTPTILLLTPGGQFHSFGFTARDFYHDLSPKEAARWLYFEKFKMALHFCNELNSDTKLAAANGQCVPAIDVFSHALRFFRTHTLQEISDQVSTEVLNEDIYWIITVPAIWTDESKQFMRLAAYRAGIASPNFPDQLLIALEPEAASIYVRKQRLHQLVPDAPVQRRRSYHRRSVTPEPTAVDQPITGSTERKVLPTAETGQIVKTVTTVSVSWPVVTTLPKTDITVGHQVDTAGTRYMIVDCGGGTVDITVHEIQSRDGTLKELHRATGGPFGSVAVDQEFEKLLNEIFGSDFIDVFKSKRPAGWVDLLMAFESRKRAANPYITKPLNVSLPFSFIDYHKKYRNCPVEHAIRKYENRDVRWSSQGMLRLMPDAMYRLFLPAFEKIKEAIGNVLNHNVRGLKFLFLVGGFAESPMLQLVIRQEFGHLLKVIIPNDASISILKGAVCFGLDPTVITTRKSRMTYGVGVLNRFIRGQHPQSKLIIKEGEEWCTDVFDALVYADESVAIGDTVVRRYTLVPGDSDDVTVSKIVNIYSSDRKAVKFVTDAGVTRCGTLCLLEDHHRKSTHKDREVQVRMTFGHTEIKVVAVDLSTRKSVRATIDFLNK